MCILSPNGAASKSSSSSAILFGFFKCRAERDSFISFFFFGNRIARLLRLLITFLPQLGSPYIIMHCLPPPLGLRIRTWLRDYDRIQSLALLLIYIQIGCALLGSLGALFNGVLLINLVIALFALVAIESSSQRLGRTYAVLLFCAIVLDVAWFILFSHTIWNFGLEKYGPSLVFSVRLAFSMQIIGFSMRFLSLFLWIQMYSLGAATVHNSAYQEADFDTRNDFINPSPNVLARDNSNSSDILGGSIYYPAYYSSLFEDTQERFIQEGHERGSTSATGSPQLKSCVSRSFQTTDGS